MRILIVTHAPLDSQFGAGQIAMNLGQALQKNGHKVKFWSPCLIPIAERKQPQFLKQLQTFWQNRANLDKFLSTQEPFDIIDSSANLVTNRLTKLAPIIVVRSVQPQILYFIESLRGNFKFNFISLLKTPIHVLSLLIVSLLIIQSWSRATDILCLGTIELSWMKKWFPWWQYKLRSYVSTLAESEQKALLEVRQNRQLTQNKQLRFLWIGRWDFHKGTDRLIDFIFQRLALFPEDTFTIAGCGDRATNDILQKLGYLDQIKLIPTFTREQLYSLLASHDIGLFTSYVEGWGLVLNEMLESGMTVFATQAGGVIELQLLFKNMLKAFPPPDSFIKEDLVNNLFPIDYYEVYNWAKIANIYDQLATRHIP